MTPLLFASLRWLRNGLLIPAGCSALICFAQASEPSHAIDMTRPILAPNGKPMKDADDKPGTLGHAIARVLMGIPDNQATLQDLLARAALAKRIEDNPKAELTAAETALIEKLLVKGYGTPAVISQIVPLIDPAAKPGEIKP